MYFYHQLVTLHSTQIEATVWLNVVNEDSNSLFLTDPEDTLIPCYCSWFTYNYIGFGKRCFRYMQFQVTAT